ncbi:MAG: 4-hydroxy-tetrahydrodipicolinate reductase [Planctomycetota bacterium]
MSTRLIMHGASGRMGRRILALALEDPDSFTIAAGVDREAGSLLQLGIACDAPLLDALPTDPGAVVIDFSTATAVESVVAHCASHGMPLGIGTTGTDPDAIAPILDEAAKQIPVLHAPNMSVGVNVVFEIAARIATTLGEDYDIEVVEAHHKHKLDAPSGTALGLTDAICDATGRGRTDLVHGREGHTGERRRGEIGVHALRMGDVVGDHTAYFVGNGERILLGHMAHTRDIFASGALRVARFLDGQAPGHYTMKDVLGL